jgi:UDP-N-acetylglucosamine transferase subunit ALG13
LASPCGPSGAPLQGIRPLIFATVGTQLPFDRMIRALDAWAGQGRRDDIFAQIGPSSIRPAHLRWKQFVEPSEFERLVGEASVVVAHAGMGSILTAIDLGRPIIVMPRLARLGEHRNDHQLSTAARLAERGLHVAHDDAQLIALLERASTLTPPHPAAPTSELSNAVRAFIFAWERDQSSRVPSPLLK